MVNRIVREITDQDLPGVVDLWLACDLVKSGNDPWRDLELARRGSNSTILLTVYDGVVAGTAMIGHDGHRGWIYYLATAPELRGRGLGRTLMNAVEEWLHWRGIWKVNLMVREDNVSILDFYRHLGYDRAEVICLQKELIDK